MYKVVTRILIFILVVMVLYLIYTPDRHYTGCRPYQSDAITGEPTNENCVAPSNN